MSELKNILPVAMNERHINDLHIQIVDFLKQRPATYLEIKNKVTKPNGKQYSKSYIRKVLSQLQHNDIVRKEYLTHRYTFYVISEWTLFKSTWDRRRKRMKRNIFNDANREIPSVEEIQERESKLKKKDEDNDD